MMSHEPSVDELSLTPVLEPPGLVVPPTLLQNNVSDLSTNENVTPSLILSKPPSSSSSSKKHVKSRPAFVTKLWTMVNDPENQDLISWSPSGDSFIVQHREKFVARVLPKYFKHSNFASFVRQLNMYGWHKVQDVNAGSMLAQGEENWGFVNPYFKKGRADLLDKIVRNKPGEEGVSGVGAHADKVDVHSLLNELNTLKSNQAKITQELSRVRQDNDLLWTELFQNREKNTFQTEKIERILQFLASVYGNRVKQLDDNMMPYMQPQLDDHQANPGQQIQQYHQPIHPSQVPQNFNLSQEDPRFRPRLMLKEYRHASNSSNAPSPMGQSQRSSSNKPNQEDIHEIVRNPTMNPYVNGAPYQEYPPYLEGQVGVGPVGAAPYPPDYSVPQTPSDQSTPSRQQFASAISSRAQTPQSVSAGGPPQSIARPAVGSGASFHDLSKSIDQQGQEIDDLISRLQKQQADNYENSSDGSNAGNFDLNEFLEQDFLDNGAGTPKPVDNTNINTNANFKSAGTRPPLVSGIDDQLSSATSTSTSTSNVELPPYAEEAQIIPEGSSSSKDGFKSPQHPSSRQLQQPNPQRLNPQIYQQQQQQQYAYPPNQQPQQYPHYYSPQRQLQHQQQLHAAQMQLQQLQHQQNQFNQMITMNPENSGTNMSRPVLSKRGSIQVINDHNGSEFKVSNPNESNSGATVFGGDGVGEKGNDKKRHVASEEGKSGGKKRKSDI